MSLVANGQGGPNCGGGQPVTNAGYNIDTGSTCGFSTANNSKSNTSPQLGPLASNGGPTQTMALPSGSPAVDAIPATTPGCTGTTDQRGTTRPQGTGYDIGAYELVQTGLGHLRCQRGLTVTGTTSSSVSLSWNASTGSPTGYTVYRNGTSVGTTGGPAATTYTDGTVSRARLIRTRSTPSAAGNHWAQSSAVQATTPAPGGVTAGSVWADMWGTGGGGGGCSRVTCSSLTFGESQELVRACLRVGQRQRSMDPRRRPRPRSAAAAAVTSRCTTSRTPPRDDLGLDRDVPGRRGQRLQRRG